MKNRKKVILALLLSSFMLLTACGGKEEAEGSPKEEETKTKTEAAEKVDDSAPEETETAGDSAEAGVSADRDVLNPNIEEQSQGNVETVFTNKEANFVHDMDGFKVAVEEYQIVKVTDISTDFAIPFDDQTEGYVMTAKVTIDNTTDKGIYYNNKYRVQLGSESDYISNDINKTFVKEEFPKSEKETEIGKFAPGEKVSGLISFIFTNEEFAALQTVSPKFVIEGGAADNDQFSGSFKGNAVFDFPYSDGQQAELESATAFYPDRLTTGNMADKEMIFEKTGINETQQLESVKVTLEGVQYTEVLPTPDNKERFRNFGDNGIVALTVKLKLDNQSDLPLSLWNIKSMVTVDGNRGNALSQGMVEPDSPRELRAGEQGEKYHVFMFRKDEFEIFKTFDLQFGPFVGPDGKELFKGKSVKFTLPR